METRSRPLIIYHFVIQGLIRILATNSYFDGRFLFQLIIGLKTDLSLNDGFLQHNCSPDPPWFPHRTKNLAVICNDMLKRKSNKQRKRNFFIEHLWATASEIDLEHEYLRRKRI